MVVQAGVRLHTERSTPDWSMVATPGLLDDQITAPLAMDGASRAVLYRWKYGQEPTNSPSAETGKIENSRIRGASEVGFS